MSTKLMTESSVCSAITVYAAPEYTPVTVVSTYTISCPFTGLEILTAVAIVTADVLNDDQNAVNKTSSIKTTVEHSAKTVIKTVMLTSLPSSCECKNMTMLLITALPTSFEGVGYVETAECASFLCVFRSYLPLYV